MAINPTGLSSNTYIQTSSNINTGSERIASGLRINSAADDAAGLAIANRMSGQINEFQQSIRNANDGVSYLQTAEGGLSSIIESIQRLRELALQASNGTLNQNDRDAINKESEQLKNEITRTIESTRFNETSVLNSTNDISIQVGDDATNDSIDVSLDNYDDFLTNINFADIDLSSSTGASSALSTLGQLQEKVDSSSADIGAQINRLDSTISNLYNREENTAASRSRIEDADLAKEISELVANQLQQDISISLQAQANSNSGNVLRLLSN